LPLDQVFQHHQSGVFWSKSPPLCVFNVHKLLKEEYLQKLNCTLTVKAILIGLIGYLCAFIFEPYAED